jgi:hypothetical protein
MPTGADIKVEMGSVELLQGRFVLCAVLLLPKRVESEIGRQVSGAFTH